MLTVAFYDAQGAVIYAFTAKAGDEYLVPCPLGNVARIRVEPSPMRFPPEPWTLAERFRTIADVLNAEVVAERLNDDSDVRP